MTQDEKEMLRAAGLEVLARTNTVPRTAKGVKREVERELGFEVSIEDVESMLEFHRGTGLVGFEHDPNGATKWWRVTTAGVLAAERS